MRSSLDFTRMCDRCFKPLLENEDWFGFNVTDDFKTVRLFKGHQSCVDEMTALFNENYILKEDDEK